MARIAQPYIARRPSVITRETAMKKLAAPGRRASTVKKPQTFVGDALVEGIDKINIQERQTEKWA